jgi:hypothetical protein
MKLTRFNHRFVKWNQRSMCRKPRRWFLGLKQTLARNAYYAREWSKPQGRLPSLHPHQFWEYD